MSLLLFHALGQAMHRMVRKSVRSQYLSKLRSCGIVDGTVTKLRVSRSRNRGWILGTGKDLSVLWNVHTDIRPTHSPIKWVPGALYPVWNGREVKLATHLHLVPTLKVSGATHPVLHMLTTHLHLVPRLRVSGAAHPVLHMPSWRAQKERYFTLLLFSNGTTAPWGPGPPHYRGFTITLRHTTLGRTPQDEWSARRRDPYPTTRNTHKRQTPKPPSGFEPTIPARERLQNHVLDGATTGKGRTG
jgi:hypothetical protein